MGPLKNRRPPTRADNAIEPVIPADLWQRTQDRLWVRRRQRRDKEQMIQVLKERLAEHPGLNCLDLEAMGLRSRRAYTNAFGSVSRALELAGRDPHVVRAQHERQKVVGRRVGDRINRDIAELLRVHGIACSHHPRSRVLVVNGAVRMRLQVLWPRNNRGRQRWYVLKARRPIADLVLLAQMTDEEHAMRFMLIDRAEYRSTTPWLDEQLPPYLTPITTGQNLVQAIRDRLASIRPQG